MINPMLLPSKLFIQQDPSAGLGYRSQRQLQLQTAIAAQGAEDIPGQALRVDTNHRRPAMDITQHQRNRAFDLLAYRLGSRAARLRINPRTFEPENAEMAPAGGKIRIRYLLDTFQWHTFN